MNWQKEIIDLHHFFQDWFNGALPKTDASFDRFRSVLHPQFHIIAPSGGLTAKPSLLDGLFAAHGQNKQIQIWVENLNLQWESDTMLLATYEEHQATGEKQTARISTVAFVPTPNLPNGVQWLHVHETWLSE